MKGWLAYTEGTQSAAARLMPWKEVARRVAAGSAQMQVTVMDELWTQQGGVPIGGLVSRRAATCCQAPQNQ
eukprot:15011683-Alexandrium_andersonii.AAC.1